MMNEEKLKKREKKEADIFLIKFLLLTVTVVSLVILWYVMNMHTLMVNEIEYKNNPNHKTTRAYSIENTIE